MKPSKRVRYNYTLLGMAIGMAFSILVLTLFF